MIYYKQWHNTKYEEALQQKQEKQSAGFNREWKTPPLTGSPSPSRGEGKGVLDEQTIEQKLKKGE